jgi:hypothetical protein
VCICVCARAHSVCTCDLNKDSPVSLPYSVSPTLVLPLQTRTSAGGPCCELQSSSLQVTVRPQPSLRRQRARTDMGQTLTTILWPLY